MNTLKKHSVKEVALLLNAFCFWICVFILLYHNLKIKNFDANGIPKSNSVLDESAYFIIINDKKSNWN